MTAAVAVAWPALPLPKDPPQQLHFPGWEETVDVAALRKDLAEMAAQKRSRNTQRAYAADLRDFHAFCLLTGRSPCPAKSETVYLYLVYEARQGLALASITRRLAAISNEHRLAGLASPVNEEVAVVLQDIRRRIGAAQHPKTPISVETLFSMLDNTDDDVRGRRDRALLLVGFASGLRRSELAALDLADVAKWPEGIILHVARSKTDQAAAGRSVGIHFGQREATCPVRTLDRWLLERGSWPGPLFCRIDAFGKIRHHRLAPAAIAGAVKAAAKRAGLEPKLYAAHSLRSGCATSASKHGADIVSIKARLGHRSIATTVKYVRFAEVLGVDPLKGVL